MENGLLARENAEFCAGSNAGSAGSDALSYLQSVYNDPLQSTHTRLKAAAIAIEYERPLAVTAVVDGGDFAARLERALARSAKVINGKAKGQRQQERPIEGSPAPVDVRHPPPVPDRRFRRA
jgi:hypothetical protein